MDIFSLPVGFNQGLSASQQYFFLITNQHQLCLSAQKTTIEKSFEFLKFKRHVKVQYSESPINEPPA